MFTVKATKWYVILAGLIAILAASFVVYPLYAQEADTTPPTFVSATTDAAGEKVIVTFSEDITVPDLVLQVSEQYGVSLSDFYKAVTDVNVGDKTGIPFSASLSGAELTLGLRSALVVTTGETVTVSYDNVFAVDAELFIDAAGNPMGTFSDKPVTNVSTATGSGREGPVLTPDGLTIAEGGTATYTVALPEQPSGDVTVDLMAFPVYLEVSSGSLTFTAENWDTAQTVTITSYDDDIEFNIWGAIAHFSSGGGYGNSQEKYMRIVVEDDGA